MAGKEAWEIFIGRDGLDEIGEKTLIQYNTYQEEFLMFYSTGK